MSKLSRLSRFAATALACALLTACPDSSTAPETAQNIEVTNVFATGAGGANRARANFAGAAIQISKIRLTVYASPSGTVLFQQVYDVDPTASKWTLKFTAPVGETLKITAELISVTGGQQKVEYSGQVGPLTLQECTTNCTPIPVKTYPGPLENLNATSVTITPDGASVVAGQTTNLTATVAPANGTFTVVWSSLTTSVATVNASGVVTGVDAGTAKIIAAVGTVADTVNITVTPANTCVETPYTLGSTANGTWTAGDCLAASGSGRHYDMYAMTLAQSSTFTLSVNGAAGRRVSVRQAGTQNYVQLMASDAFMPPATNPLVIGYALPAGSYVIEIATPDAATLGNYTLSSSTGLPGGCATVVYVWPSVTVNGSLGNTDCTSPDGVSREDRYIVLPDAGVRLALSLAPTGFAPVLVYRDDRQGPASPTLAYDVQSTVGAPAKVAYTTTFAGFTEIVVSHANTGGTGNYQLTIGTEAVSNTCATIPTTIGSNRLAVWENTDCKDATRLWDKYSFTTTQATGITATLASSQVGAKGAGVYVGTTEILDWGAAASTMTDLKATWFLAPGSYDFVFSAPTSAAGQPYTASVGSTTDIACTNNAASGSYTFNTQSLGGNDCRLDSDAVGIHKYEDRVTILLGAGKTVDAAMTASFASRMVIRDPQTAAGSTLTFTDAAANAEAKATYTNNTGAARYIQIIYTSVQNDATGTYSGSITVR